MPGDGGAAGEVPVLVVGGELLGHVRLDDVHPVGEGHLARPGLRRREENGIGYCTESEFKGGENE